MTLCVLGAFAREKYTWFDDRRFTPIRDLTDMWLSGFNPTTTVRTIQALISEYERQHAARHV
jgi:hypothetical protein